MCTSIVATNHWHLSVLNLLPFSKNDAASLSHDSMPASVAMTHHLFPSLPVLSTSMPCLQQDSAQNNALSSDSSRSSNTLYPSTKGSRKNRQSGLKVSPNKDFRTQSCRMSRRDEVTSEHESKFGDSTDLDSTTFLLNVNGQSRRENREDSSKSDGCTSLPKPVFKPAKCWNLCDQKKRHYKTGYEERELERRTRSMDLEQSSRFPHATRQLKVNVKELPRSRTPIADNDPDKLNMNQVIAFLQANTAVTDNECRGRSSNNAEHVASTNTAQLSKRLALRQALPHSGRKDAEFDKQQQRIKYNPSYSDPNSTSGLVKPREMSTNRNSTSRRSSCNSESSTNTDSNGAYGKAYRHFSLRHRSRADVVHQQGNNENPVDRSQHLTQNERPSIFVNSQTHLKNKEKHMFTDPCRSQNGSMAVSYRLNRFLGLEKDESKNVVTILSGPQDHHQSVVDSAKEALKSTPSVTGVCKHPELHTRLCSFPSVRYENSKIIYRQDKRLDSNLSHTQSLESEQTLNKNKVICLPTAQLEADSEEEPTLLSNIDKLDSKPDLTPPVNVDRVRGKFELKFPASVDRVPSELDLTIPGPDCEVLKTGNTISNTEGNYKSNSKTTVEHLTSFSDAEPAQNNAIFNTENIALHETTVGMLDFQTVHIKLNELSNRLSEGSLVIPAHPVITVADITHNKRQQQDLLKLSNPEAHGNQLFRFLNVDLATMTRTHHWLEDHSKLFPPLIHKHRQPDESQASTKSSEQIRLSLRKERNNAPVNTYMTDMGEHQDQQ